MIRIRILLSCFGNIGTGMVIGYYATKEIGVYIVIVAMIMVIIALTGTIYLDIKEGN